MYDSRAIAQVFVEKAAECSSENLPPFTQLKIIKLVYLAHAYSLYILKKPLINNIIATWPYGPVIPELYHTISYYGRDPVLKIDGFSAPSDLTEDAAKAIDVIFDRCKSWTASQLCTYTHSKGSAWQRAVEQAGMYCVISNQFIIDCCTKEQKIA